MAYQGLKPWNWKIVHGDQRLHWQTPAMEVFHFANLLRKESKRKVYDLGCGLGRNLFFLIDQEFDVQGSELSLHAVNEVNKELERMNYPHRIKQQCMTSFSEPPESFDAVIAYNVVYHALRADLEKTLYNAQNVLKPDGLIFSTFLVKPDNPFYTNEVEPNTIVKEGGEEDGIPHHFIMRDELPKLLTGFELIQVWERVWEYDNFNKKCRHLCVIARKIDSVDK